MRNQRYILMGFFSVATFSRVRCPWSCCAAAGSHRGGRSSTRSFSGTDALGIIVGVVTFLVMNRPPVVHGFQTSRSQSCAKWCGPTRKRPLRSATVVVVTLFIAATLAMYDFVWARVTSTFLFSEG